MNALIKSLNTFGVEESCVCYDQVVNVNSHYQRFTSILFQCKDTRITYGSNKHIVAKLATEGDEEPSMTDHAGENSLYGITLLCYVHVKSRFHPQWSYWSTCLRRSRRARRN